MSLIKKVIPYLAGLVLFVILVFVATAVISGGAYGPE